MQHPPYQRRPNSGRLYSNAYIIILARQRQRLISPGSIRNGFSLSISIAPETDDERGANRRRYRRLPTTIGLVPPPRNTSDSQNAATTASFSRNCDKTKGRLNARCKRGYRTRASHAARSSTGWRGQKARDAGNLLRRCTSRRTYSIEEASACVVFFPHRWQRVAASGLLFPRKLGDEREAESNSIKALIGFLATVKAPTCSLQTLRKNVGRGGEWRKRKWLGGFSFGLQIAEVVAEHAIWLDVLLRRPEVWELKKLKD